MGNRWKLLVVLLACGCLLLGCDKDKPAKPAKPAKVTKTVAPAKPAPKPKPAPAPVASTPKAVVLAILKATSEGDGEAVAAHTDCSAEDKAFIKKSLSIMGKVVAFTIKGSKAYGKEAWAAAAKKADMANFAEPPKELDPDAQKTLKCKVEGDKAACTMEGVEKPLNLVKKGGVWLAVPDEMPPKDKRAEMLAGMAPMAKAAEDATAKIGKPGVTAEQVFQGFAKALGAP